MPDGMKTAPPSDARKRLAAAISAVTAATKAHESIIMPERRLRTLIQRSEILGSQTKELRATEDAKLAEWLIGGEGPKPEPSAELVAAEDATAEAERDARAAEAALADCAARGAKAAEATNSAVEARDTALFAVIAEECERVGRVIAERFRAALAVDAELAALGAALLVMTGDRNATDAFKGMAGNVVGLITDLRQSARYADAQSARGSTETARRFVDRLKGDSNARFGALQ